jgi:hypothetical protein
MNGTVPPPTDTEVTSIQRTGFWVFVDGTEYFVDFEEYPDFKTVGAKSTYRTKSVQFYLLVAFA